MPDCDLVRKTLLPILCCLAALAVAVADPQAPPAAPTKPAAETASEPDMNALADQVLAQLRGRLKLTDDQIVRIRPLLVDHLGKVRQMF